MVQSLHERLAATEQRQQVLINFFASALKDPRILHRLLSTMSPAGNMQRIMPGPGVFTAHCLYSFDRTHAVCARIARFRGGAITCAHESVLGLGKARVLAG
eukprot:1149653-Pelagomonas_calceolata.AAC.8